MDMGKKYTENKKNYNIEYRKKAYKRIVLDIKKEYHAEVLSKIPELTGLSLSGFIKDAIREKIERDGLDLPDVKA